MANELTESTLKRLSISLVSSGVIAGAGIGYFTIYVPYETPIDIVVGDLAGGLLLGVLPALVSWKLLIRNVRE